MAEGRAAWRPSLRARLSRDFPEEQRQRFRVAYAGRRWPELAYQRARETNAVTVHLYDPAGVLQHVTNPSGYLAARDASPPVENFLRAARGHRLSAGGWTTLPAGPRPGVVTPVADGYTCQCCGLHLVAFSEGMARRRHADRCQTGRDLLEAAFLLGNLSPDEYEERKSVWNRLGEELHRRQATPVRGLAGVLVAPDGALHEVASPVTSFCAAHHLDASLVCKLLKGRIGSHRGWRVHP